MGESDFSRFGDCDGLTECHNWTINVPSECGALYVGLYQYPFYDLYVLVYRPD